MKVLVCHRFRGCETGCCGHVVIVEDDLGNRVSQSDLFAGHGHPCGDAVREYVIAKVTDELGEEHVKDIDWDRCEVIDD